MTADEVFQRYQELQAYVGWAPEEAPRVAALAEILAPALPGLVDDFYAEIERHPRARRVITGGAAQIERLKGTLLVWLRELLCGRYDLLYVTRRWRVGWQHVEVGLEQVYTNAALSRLRRGLGLALQKLWTGPAEELHASLRSLDTLLDLDLAIIEEAYQAEYVARQQRVERLAAIGQVSGGVAHELRNPLNVIGTSVYYLLHADPLLPEKRDEHMARIERQVALADGVITALSNFARLPMPNQAPFSVVGCLREALETTALPDNITVSIEAEEGLQPALADQDQVRIVLSNLIRNARDAMPEGGRLLLSCRQIESGDGGDRHLEIDVADTGEGIPADRLAHIMEPLYSTKAKGLGLGLAIARAILEKNQGALRVQSEPGKGSTFTVVLQPVDSSQ
jgi:signal transduction histidine kinase